MGVSSGPYGGRLLTVVNILIAVIVFIVYVRVAVEFNGWFRRSGRPDAIRHPCLSLQATSTVAALTTSTVGGAIVETDRCQILGNSSVYRVAKHFNLHKSSLSYRAHMSIALVGLATLTVTITRLICQYSSTGVFVGLGVIWLGGFRNRIGPRQITFHYVNLGP